MYKGYDSAQRRRDIKRDAPLKRAAQLLRRGITKELAFSRLNAFVTSKM